MNNNNNSNNNYYYNENYTQTHKAYAHVVWRETQL